MRKDHLNIYVAELLRERKFSAEYENVIRDFVKDISACLKIKPKKNVLAFAEKLPCPLDDKGEILKYQQPNSVYVTGCHAWKSAHLSTSVEVELLVEIPSTCIHSKDYVNEAVLRRRAQYLRCVAAVLFKQKFVGGVKYLYPNGNNKKPLLVVYPETKNPDLPGMKILIDTSFETGTFKLNRFHAKKNNIRKKFYFPSDDAPEGDAPMTSHYNAMVLSSLAISDNNTFIKDFIGGHDFLREGIILIMIWLERRNLTKGFRAGLVMSAYVVYLFKIQKLKQKMSPLEIFSTTLENLCQLDLETKGISLFEGEITDDNQPKLSDFHETDELVFVDVSGYWNLCHDLNGCQFDNIKMEARDTLTLMASSCPGMFQQIFLDEISFPCKFDHVIHLHDTDHLKRLCASRKSLQHSTIDRCGNYVAACANPVASVLKKALGNRISLLGYLPPEDVEVGVTDDIDYDSIMPARLTFGLILDKIHANVPEIKGPSAELAQEALEFQKFWGEKAEQYRYPGGEIIECVKWPADTSADLRTIVSKVVKFILKRHFNISKENISISGSQLDGLLKPTEGKSASQVSVYGTGEEQHDEVIKSSEMLRNFISGMDDLPLAVNDMFGLSPLFRFADVFPPVRSASQYDAGTYNDRLVPLVHGKCPQFFPLVKVFCMLEGSGKWPDDRTAIQKLKAAFYIKIASKLKKLDEYNCLVYPDKLYVHRAKDTFVFQIEIGYMREIALARKVVYPDGQVLMKDTDESVALEKNYVLLPTLTSLIHSLYQQNNSFSCTVRLAKRWVSSQMLHGYVPEEAVELCAAHPYTSDRPPSSPVLGFVRFLHLVSTHDWKLEPLIVNLNNAYSVESYEEIRKNFTNNRKNLPSMFIATPGNDSSAAWTSARPTPVFLSRLVMVAGASLKTLSDLIMTPPLGKKEFKAIFRPPTSDYNLLIHLDLGKCSRAHLGVDFYFDSSHPPPKKSARPDNLFPVVDFDPPMLYLRDLKAKFSEYAYFFYDAFGGKYIAVAWKPSAFKPRPIPMQEAPEKHFKVVEETLTSEQAYMIADEDKLIAEFQSLGPDMVSNVEVIAKLN